MHSFSLCFPKTGRTNRPLHSPQLMRIFSEDVAGSSWQDGSCATTHPSSCQRLRLWTPASVRRFASHTSKRQRDRKEKRGKTHRTLARRNVRITAKSDTPPPRRKISKGAILQADRQVFWEESWPKCRATEPALGVRWTGRAYTLKGNSLLYLQFSQVC